MAQVGDYKDKELLQFNKSRWEADARLIAAAPLLLEALKGMLEYDAHSYTQALKNTRAAITAATGGE